MRRLLTGAIALATTACGILLGHSGDDDDPPPPVLPDDAGAGEATSDAGAPADCDASFADDPDNCGACGRVCQSRGCTNGVCDLVVFVTSAAARGDAIGGWAGADKLCAAAKNTAKLEGDFVAWISVFGGEGTSPNQRLRLERKWRRLDGTLVANGFGELGSGRLLAPISIDENGKPAAFGTSVWTGTGANGFPTGDTCSGWTTGPVLRDIGTIGTATESEFRWSNAASVDCTQSHRLYCFQR